MHIIGIGGHPRRYFDSDDVQHPGSTSSALNQFMTHQRHSAGLVAVHLRGQLRAAACSAAEVAGRNPWHSNTLEWTAPSPPPHGNFETPPIVHRGPYEYGVPGMEEDYLPQTDAASGRRAATGRRRIDHRLASRGRKPPDGIAIGARIARSGRLRDPARRNPDCVSIARPTTTCPAAGCTPGPC